MLATKTMQHTGKSLMQATFLPSATHTYIRHEVLISMP